MMENFLTEKVLHEALQLYLATQYVTRLENSSYEILRKYFVNGFLYLLYSAYNAVTQWDLFEIIERQAFTHGVYPDVASFTEIMESWTLQPVH